MSKEWQGFWENYRNVDAQNDDDLFVQVGKTIKRRPIPREMHARMVSRIVERLQLAPDDHLLDMCCGNGLVSFELAPVVRHITAVDFARHLIETANRFKAGANIRYVVGDVCAPIAELCAATLDANAVAVGLPTKFLMSDALGYLEPSTFALILDNIRSALVERPFRFLMTGIPNDSLKWNFYDTPERRERHLENVRAGDGVNDGLGRWWQADEIESVCAGQGLRVILSDQPVEISNYRMDALVWRE